MQKLPLDLSNSEGLFGVHLVWCTCYFVVTNDLFMTIALFDFIVLLLLTANEGRVYNTPSGQSFDLKRHSPLLPMATTAASSKQAGNRLRSNTSPGLYFKNNST